jgi:hypothetical protein
MCPFIRFVLRLIRVPKRRFHVSAATNHQAGNPFARHLAVYACQAREKQLIIG